MNAKLAANNVYHYKEKYGPGRCGHILTKIEEASKQGDDVLTLYVKLEDQEREHLESLGFSVSTSTITVGFFTKSIAYCVRIRW